MRIDLAPSDDAVAYMSDRLGTNIVLAFRSVDAVGAGYFHLDWSVDRNSASCACRVAFDTGAGFTPQASIPVPAARRPDARRRGVYFHTSTPICGLRLDCAAESGGIDSATLVLRRLGPVEYHLRIALSAMHHFRDNGRSTAWIARRALHLLRQMGPAAFVARLRDIGTASVPRRDDYERWIEEREAQPLAPARDLPPLEQQPLISILMPVYNAPDRFLRAALDSIRAQTYAHWELCIVDDGSTDENLRALLRDLGETHSRVRVRLLDANGGISAATNAAFEMSSGAWIVLFDQDDLLAPYALAEVFAESTRHPEAAIIYSDEDKITEDGRRYDPYFKPDFSPELLHSQNYFNHLTALRAELVRKVGGWRSSFDGSQDYDLILRILACSTKGQIRHIPRILYHWRAHEGSTALSGGEKDYAFDAGLRALQDHVRRIGLDARVERAEGTPFYRIRHHLPEDPPLVSVIVPTRDQLDLLSGCIDSLARRTDYPAIEIIIVDNNSSRPETLHYLADLDRKGIAKVLRYDAPFNYSAINNFAVSHAKGSVLALLNNDIEAISSNWLREMVSWAIQPGVGCVGAKLYFGDGSIQHAGVVLGIGGVAGHAHKHFPRHHPGSFYRLKIVQNFSAVTGACLVVRKAVYKAVGGLDEEHLKVAFNDVDFCLKVGDAGYRNVWTPYAELYHYESVSRGTEDTPEKRERFRREIAYMRKRWLLDDDPCYSPNLTLDREDFSVGYDRPVRRAADRSGAA